MANDGLTPKQRRFVEAFQGNATAAAIAAGYSEKTAREQGRRLLTKVDIADAIKKREDKTLAPLIASRGERQEKLTEIIRSLEEKTADRIKAIEILGKMNGDFLERVEHSGGFAVRWARPWEAAHDG